MRPRRHPRGAAAIVESRHPPRSEQPEQLLPPPGMARRSTWGARGPAEPGFLSGARV